MRNAVARTSSGIGCDGSPPAMPATIDSTAKRSIVSSRRISAAANSCRSVASNSASDAAKSIDATPRSVAATSMRPNSHEAMVYAIAVPSPDRRYRAGVMPSACDDCSYRRLAEPKPAS